jgi:hypothetical protein
MSRLLYTGLVVLAVGLASAPAALGDDKTDNAKARADAARRVFDSLWNTNASQTPSGKTVGAGATDYDQVFVWSVRWIGGAAGTQRQDGRQSSGC